MSDYFKRAALMYLQEKDIGSSDSNINAAIEKLKEFDLMRYCLKKAEDTK